MKTPDRARLALASLLLATAPAMAADYVQAPGSTPDPLPDREIFELLGFD